jgi:tetratricopeptide (TPR) repeat protein
MRCPHCGTETPGGKFCASCGGSLAAAQPQPPAYPQQAAAYQPMYQPTPPAPPKKRSLTWLWITLGVVGALLLGFVALVMLSDDEPITPTGTNSPVATSGADGILKTYLNARKAGDLFVGYAALSPKARATFTQDEYAAYYKEFKLVSFGQMEVTQSQDPWYRVTVRDVAYSDMTMPTAVYTVTKVDGKFYVALDSPLTAKIDKAYEAQQYDVVLQLTSQMLAIDPYSYQAYYSRGWALADTGKYQDALTAFTEAGKYVLNEEKPELARSVGATYGRLKLWVQAVEKMEEAQKLGQALPNSYDKAWLRQVGVDLVTAYQTKGDFIKSHDLLEKLYKEDPNDEKVHGMAVKYERLAYNVTSTGFAHYRLFLQGVSFAIPSDWVISSETTGGDWWFARHPQSAEKKVDLGVYFHGDDLGKTLDEAAQGLLKRKREPLGAPPQNVDITRQEAITLAKQPALRIEFSDGTTSFLLKARQQWVDFAWYNNPTAKAAIAGWLETVGVFN